MKINVCFILSVRRVRCWARANENGYGNPKNPACRQFHLEKVRAVCGVRGWREYRGRRLWRRRSFSLWSHKRKFHRISFFNDAVNSSVVSLPKPKLNVHSFFKNVPPVVALRSFIVLWNIPSVCFFYFHVYYIPRT